jgi:hypothetical protein
MMNRSKCAFTHKSQRELSSNLRDKITARQLNPHPPRHATSSPPPPCKMSPWTNEKIYDIEMARLGFWDLSEDRLLNTVKSVNLLLLNLLLVFLPLLFRPWSPYG